MTQVTALWGEGHVSRLAADREGGGGGGVRVGRISSRGMAGTQEDSPDQKVHEGDILGAYGLPSGRYPLLSETVITKIP